MKKVLWIFIFITDQQNFGADHIFLCAPAHFCLPSRISVFCQLKSNLSSHLIQYLHTIILSLAAQLLELPEFLLSLPKFGVIKKIFKKKFISCWWSKMEKVNRRVLFNSSFMNFMNRCLQTIYSEKFTLEQVF